ncbi:MAG: methyltransferase [Clostridiales bacterium]|nr:methyltransferase [Clostridiales bacterium]
MTNTPEKINNDVSVYQHERALAFGTDAYLLSAYVKRGAGRALELGAGSGVISLLCAAKEKFTSCTCVEVQRELAEICQKNTQGNVGGDKITVVNSDMRELPAAMNESFDMVFTNPPYMRADSGKMNIDKANTACRHEIYGTIDDFCIAASRLLKFGGLFYAVYRPDRLSELLSACENANLSVKALTLVYPTVSHVPSIVLVRAKKGAAKGMKTSKPLIIYSSRDDMTDEGFTADMKYIYENGDFDDSFR